MGINNYHQSVIVTKITFVIIIVMYIFDILDYWLETHLKHTSINTYFCDDDIYASIVLGSNKDNNKERFLKIIIIIS